MKGCGGCRRAASEGPKLTTLGRASGAAAAIVPEIRVALHPAASPPLARRRRALPHDDLSRTHPPAGAPWGTDFAAARAAALAGNKPIFVYSTKTY